MKSITIAGRFGLTDHRWFWFFAIVAVMLTIQINSAIFVGNQQPVGDGLWYVELSKGDWESFLVSPRPPFYPLMLKLLGGKIYLVQKLIYFISCLILIMAIFQRVNSVVVAIISSMLILIITSSPNYIFWNEFILTESYALSGSIFLAACTILVPILPWFFWTILFLVSATLVVARDSDLYVILSFLALTGLSYLRCWGGIARAMTAFRGRNARSHDHNSIAGQKLRCIEEPEGVSSGRVAGPASRRPSAILTNMRAALPAVSLGLLIGSICLTWYAQRAAYRYLTNLVNVVQTRLLPDRGSETVSHPKGP